MNVLLPLLLVMVLALPALAQDAPGQRLTITQNGQSLVSDSRTLTLARGKGAVGLEGLAPGLDVTTLAIKPGDGQGGLKILGLTQEPPLSGPTALLKAHVGQVLTITIPDGSTREGRARKQARLLSAEEAPLFLVDGQIYAGPVESILYPALPVGPGPRVTLAYANSGPEKRRVEVQYVAGEISWRMDYDLVSDAAFKTASLDGQATLTNRSGLPFRAAKVELLAGDVGQAPGRRMLAKASAPMMAMLEDAAGTAPEALFEHHIYKLPGLLDLPDQGLVRIPLAQSGKVSVTKNLMARASAVPSGRSSDPIPQSVQTLISFRNIGAEGLGQPLPKGVIRVYQVDDGVRRLVGEGQLERVPSGAKAEIALGQAFDVAIERTAKSYERTGKTGFKGSWELAIRNAKKEKVTLIVQESFPGKWKITESSHKPSRTTARAAEFTLDVPPTGEGQPTQLSYSFTLDM